MICLHNPELEVLAAYFLVIKKQLPQIGCFFKLVKKEDFAPHSSQTCTKGIMKSTIANPLLKMPIAWLS